MLSFILSHALIEAAMRDEIMQLRPEKTFFKYLTQPPGSLMHFHIFSSKQKLCIEMIILQWKNGRKLQELLKHNVCVVPTHLFPAS